MLFLTTLATSLAWSVPPGGAPNVGAKPSQLQYKRIDDDGGPVTGRWKRSRARYRAWELRDDTIVRLQDTSRGRVVEDRRFDATGHPLTTWYEPGSERSSIEVHTVPSREIGLSGWAPRPIPGGTVVAPLAPFDRSGGGAELLVLGGIFEVWYDPTATDAYSETFREGLLSGCGCVLVDEGAAWIDGVAAKRFRLELPTSEGTATMDLWALPLADRGVWFASYRVVAPSNETLALAPGRALISMVDLRAVDTLRPPPPPEPVLDEASEESADEEPADP